MSLDMQPSLVQPPLDGVPCAKAFVRDLEDGQPIESPFVVRDRNRREKRNGEPFLKLQLGDVTGAVEAVVWDGVEEAQAVARPAPWSSSRGATRSTSATARASRSSRCARRPPAPMTRPT